jgi:hypothetical protein
VDGDKKLNEGDGRSSSVCKFECTGRSQNQFCLFNENVYTCLIGEFMRFFVRGHYYTLYQNNLGGVIIHVVVTFMSRFSLLFFRTVYLLLASSLILLLSYSTNNVFFEFPRSSASELQLQPRRAGEDPQVERGAEDSFGGERFASFLFNILLLDQNNCSLDLEFMVR